MKDDGDPQNIRGRYNIHVLIKGPGMLKPLRNELSGFVLKSIYAVFRHAKSEKLQQQKITS